MSADATGQFEERESRFCPCCRLDGGGARADIGIAIGGGTDVPAESAGLIMVKSNPLDIVRILILSAASSRKQLQNIWWGTGQECA